MNQKVIINASKHKLADISIDIALTKDKHSSYYNLAEAINSKYFDTHFNNYHLFFNAVEFGNVFFISQSFKSNSSISDNIFFTLFMKACFYENLDIIKLFLEDKRMVNFNKKQLKNIHSKKSLKFIETQFNISNF